MTLQEQIDSHMTVVYHGHENGETLLSFDDEKEIYRFSDEEVDMVVDRYKTPEQLELDRKMKETSNLVYDEMEYRRNCNIDNIGTCFIFIIGLVVFAVISFINGHPLAALIFGAILLLGLIPLFKLFRTRKVIKEYFRKHEGE